MFLLLCKLCKQKCKTFSFSLTHSLYLSLQLLILPLSKEPFSKGALGLCSVIRMALSLVAPPPHQHQQHSSSFYDLQSLFDPYSLENQANLQTQFNFTNQTTTYNQQQQEQRSAKNNLTNYPSTDLMEFNNSNQNQSSNTLQSTTPLQSNNNQVNNNITQVRLTYFICLNGYFRTNFFYFFLNLIYTCQHMC